MGAMMLKFCVDAFVSPANHFTWMIMIVTPNLLVLVLAFPGVGRKYPVAVAALSLSLLPLLLGAFGTFHSISVVNEAIPKIPEAVLVPAKAMGVAVALSSLFVGAIPSAILLFLVCFRIGMAVIRNRKKEVSNTEGKNNNGLLRALAAGLIMLPAILGGTGVIVGQMVRLDAIANIPAARRDAAVKAGESIAGNSFTGGAVLFVVAVAVAVFVYRKFKLKGESAD